MEDQDFQVGDEVEKAVSDVSGVVIKRLSDDNEYSVWVEWEDDDTDTYTKDGRYLTEHKYPTIYHKGSITREGDKIIIDPIKPVRNKWVNVYVDANGKPYFGIGLYQTEKEAKEGNTKAVDYLITIELKRKE